MKKTYRVVTAGDIEGAWREPGDEVQLTEEQAKYPCMAGTISPAASESPAKQPRKRKASAPAEAAPETAGD